jgi:hypothetical protein
MPSPKAWIVEHANAQISNMDLDILRELTHIGDICEDQWIERFDEMKICNGTYFIVN